MSIPVECPNGHKHKVKDSFAGKVGLCPVCKAPIHVPDSASEDAIMDILQPETTGLSGIGLISPDLSKKLGEAAGAAEKPAPAKACNRCHQNIPDDAEECLHCKLYRGQIAELIRKKRLEKGMSIKEAAERAGVPEKIWNYWESGRHLMLESLPTIAKAIACTPRVLLPTE